MLECLSKFLVGESFLPEAKHTTLKVLDMILVREFRLVSLELSLFLSRFLHGPIDLLQLKLLECGSGISCNGRLRLGSNLVES